MTGEQAKNMLKAKLECLKRETSGTDFDCNNSNCDECSLCYEQGNIGEQKEALDMAIKALEQQPCKEYEEIHVGDENIFEDKKYIVINIHKYVDDVVIANETDVLVTITENVKKTGRKYPVVEMLEGLKNGGE